MSGLPPWRRPPALRSGDRVALIAPSGPLPKERLERGMAVLSRRYELLDAPGLLSRHGFLAGDDGRRLSELRWALSDPAVRAVFAGRGGHGLLRHVGALHPVERDELRPLPVVGFSDITVLHAFCSQRHLVSIHGPVVTQLGELPEDDVAALWALLEDAAPPPPLEGLLTLRGPESEVHGRLLGGNIEVLSRLCGTPLQAALHPGEPVVLLVEEVTEAPYRIDRALTQLLFSGALRDVRAVVVGDLVRCDPPTPDSPTALQVIVERAAQLHVPVLSGAPVGHGQRNRPLPIGARVTLEPRRGRLLFHDGATTRS
jgi:muramoyltetrapeptide carboxypeptidase